MDNTTLAAIAQQIREAEVHNSIIPTATATYPELSTDEAYAVQFINVSARLDNGERVIGKKVAFTSKALQQSAGIEGPAFGHLFAKALFPEGEQIAVTNLNGPRLEPEILFVMGEELRGPGVTMADVLTATKSVMPAFELVSGRFAKEGIRPADMIADNVANHGLIIGARALPHDHFNLKTLGLILEKNGEILATGAGAAVLGHPAQSVAWLVNALARFGLPLKKGELILSGAFTPPQNVLAGDTFTAHFDRLGSVTATFSA